MCDIGPCKAKDAGVACKRPFRHLWQLAIVSGRQIIADLAQLLFNKVKVIQQPLCCRHNRLACLQRLRAGPVSVQQDIGVFPNTAAQFLHGQRRARRDSLCLSKTSGVMLKPFRAKQIGTDGQTITPKVR